MDEEINKENITSLLRTLEAKTESTKHIMRSMMKANGQTLALMMTDHLQAVIK